MTLVQIISAIILGSLKGFFWADSDIKPPLTIYQLRGIYKSKLGMLFARFGPIVILAIITIMIRPSILVLIITPVLFLMMSTITGTIFLRKRVQKKKARDKSKIENFIKSRAVNSRSDENIKKLEGDGLEYE